MSLGQIFAVLPSWLKTHSQKNFFEKHYSYICLTGGRCSLKSYILAYYLVVQCISKPKQKILCTRQFHASLKKSVGQVLINIIEDMGLKKQFKITANEFIYIPNGSEVIFKGFDRNKDAIKGLEGLTHVWIEEADSLTKESWELIKPTVFRTSEKKAKLFSKESYDLKIEESKAQILISMNPKYETDCLYAEFIKSEKKPPNSYIKHLNWYENPFFNLSMHRERLFCLRSNPDIYKHIWEGELLQYSDAQIFKDRWYVQEFEEDKDAHKYYGIDFGFTNPLAVIRCYVKDNYIYITDELQAHGVLNEEIYDLCVKKIPGIKTGVVYCDNARPEAIEALKRKGLYVKACNKASTSGNYVIDCIEALRSFKIIVRPSCVNTISNLTLYSKKVDERSGLVTGKIIKAHDHFIDALKYALEPVLQNRFDSKALINEKAYSCFTNSFY